MIHRRKTMIRAFAAQPIAFVMALLAPILIIVAVVNRNTRRGQRVVMIVVATIGGMTAWMMITGWHWPSDWPRLLPNLLR
jgi:hypothetical protein